MGHFYLIEIRLEPKDDSTAELTLIGVLVVAHDPALPGPIGTAPNSTRIGANVGRSPGALNSKPIPGLGKNFTPPPQVEEKLVTDTTSREPSWGRFAGPPAFLAW